jgi:hypothetical protein
MLKGPVLSVRWCNWRQQYGTYTAAAYQSSVIITSVHHYMDQELVDTLREELEEENDGSVEELLPQWPSAWM